MPFGSRDSTIRPGVVGVDTIDDADFEGADIGGRGRVEGFDKSWSDYEISMLTGRKTPLMPDWRAD